MNDRCHLRLPILLVAAVVWSGINGPTGAEESATVPTDPGLNADTGQIKWAIQHTPAEAWDYDGVNELVLGDVGIATRDFDLLVGHVDRLAGG